MSIVCIKNHNENIYNITKKPPPPRQKSPRYVSKFKENIKSSTTCKDRAALKTHATMGVPQETLPDPSDYLKKHSGIKQMKVFNGNPTHKHLCSQLRKQKGFATKDEITSYNNHKAEEQQHRDNFIAKNIRAAVAMKPHDFNGDKVLKLHVKSKTFGKTPTYLERFVKAREKCYQARKDVVTALQKPSCVYIEKEERERLLNVIINGIFNYLGTHFYVI